MRENMEDGLNAFPFREDVNARARKRERAEDLVIMVGGVAWRRVALEDFLGWIFFVRYLFEFPIRQGLPINIFSLRFAGTSKVLLYVLHRGLYKLSRLGSHLLKSAPLKFVRAGGSAFFTLSRSKNNGDHIETPPITGPVPPTCWK